MKRKNILNNTFLGVLKIKKIKGYSPKLKREMRKYFEFLMCKIG